MRYKFRAKQERETRRRLNAARQESENLTLEERRRQQEKCSAFWEQSLAKRASSVQKLYREAYSERFDPSSEEVLKESEERISKGFQRNLAATGERLAGKNDLAEIIEELSEKNKRKAEEKKSKHFQWCKEIAEDILHCTELAIDERTALEDSRQLRYIRNAFLAGRGKGKSRVKSIDSATGNIELLAMAFYKMAFRYIFLNENIHKMLQSSLVKMRSLVSKNSILGQSFRESPPGLLTSFADFWKLPASNGLLSLLIQSSRCTDLCRFTTPSEDALNAHLTLLSSYGLRHDDVHNLQANPLSPPVMVPAKGTFRPVILGISEDVRERYASQLAIDNGVGLVNIKVLIAASLLGVAAAACFDRAVSTDTTEPQSGESTIDACIAGQIPILINALSLSRREIVTAVSIALPYIYADYQLLFCYSTCISKLKRWLDGPTQETAFELIAAINKLRKCFELVQELDCLAACGVVFKSLCGDRPYLAETMRRVNPQVFENSAQVPLTSAETIAAALLGRRKYQRSCLRCFASASASQNLQTTWSDLFSMSTTRTDESNKTKGGKSKDTGKKKETQSKGKSGNAEDLESASSTALVLSCHGGLVTSTDTLSRKRLFVKEGACPVEGEKQDFEVKARAANLNASVTVEGLLHRCPFFHGVLGIATKTLNRRSENCTDLKDSIDDAIDRTLGPPSSLQDGGDLYSLQTGMVFSGLPFNKAEAVVVEAAVPEESDIPSKIDMKRRPLPLHPESKNLCEECRKNAGLEPIKGEVSGRSNTQAFAEEASVNISSQTISLQSNTLLCSLEAPFQRSGFALCGFERNEWLEPQLVEMESESEQHTSSKDTGQTMTPTQQFLGGLCGWVEQSYTLGAKTDSAFGSPWVPPAEEGKFPALEKDLSNALKRLGIEAASFPSELTKEELTVAPLIVDSLCSFLHLTPSEDGDISATTISSSQWEKVSTSPSALTNFSEDHLWLPVSSLELALRLSYAHGRDGSGDVSFRGETNVDSSVSTVVSSYKGSLFVPEFGSSFSSAISFVIDIPSSPYDVGIDQAALFEAIEATPTVIPDMVWDYVRLTLGAVVIVPATERAESQQKVSIIPVLPLVALGNQESSTPNVFVVGEGDHESDENVLFPPACLSSSSDQGASAKSSKKKKGKSSPRESAPADSWDFKEATLESWHSNRGDSVSGYYQGMIPWARLAQPSYNHQCSKSIHYLSAHLLDLSDHSSAVTSFLKRIADHEHSEDIIQLGAQLVGTVFPANFEASQLQKTIFSFMSGVESSTVYYMDNALFSFLEFLRSTHVEMRVLLEKLEAKAFPSEDSGAFSKTNTVKERIMSARRSTDLHSTSSNISQKKDKEKTQITYTRGMQRLQDLTMKSAKLLLGQVPPRQRQRLHRQGLLVEHQAEILYRAESKEVFASVRKELMSCEELLWSEACTRREYAKKFAEMYQQNTTFDDLLNYYSDFLSLSMILETIHGLAEVASLNGFRNIMCNMEKRSTFVQEVTDLSAGERVTMSLSGIQQQAESFLTVLEKVTETEGGQGVPFYPLNSAHPELSDIESELHHTDAGVRLLGFYQRIYQALNCGFDTYKDTVKNIGYRLLTTLRFYLDFVDTYTNYRKRNSKLFEEWICLKLERDDSVIRETVESIHTVVDMAEDFYSAYSGDKTIIGEYKSDLELTEAIEAMFEDRFLRDDGLESPIKLLEFERRNALPYKQDVYIFPKQKWKEIIGRCKTLFTSVRKVGKMFIDNAALLGCSKYEWNAILEARNTFMEVLKDCSENAETERQSDGVKNESFVAQESKGSQAKLQGLNILPYGTSRPLNKAHKSAKSEDSGKAEYHRQLIKAAAKGEYIPEELLFELMTRLSSGTQELKDGHEVKGRKHETIHSTFKWDPQEEHYQLPARTTLEFIEQLTDSSWIFSASKHILSSLVLEDTIKDYALENIIQIDQIKATKLTGISSAEYQGSLWIQPKEAVHCLFDAVKNSSSIALESVCDALRQSLWNSFVSICRDIRPSSESKGRNINTARNLLTSFVEEGEMGSAAGTVKTLIDFSLNKLYSERLQSLSIYVPSKKDANALSACFPLAVVRGCLIRCIQLFGLCLTGFCCKHPIAPEQLMIEQRAFLFASIALSGEDPDREKSKTLTADCDSSQILLLRWKFSSCCNWFEVSRSSAIDLLRQHQEEIQRLYTSKVKSTRHHSARSLATQLLSHVVLNSDEKTTEKVVEVAAESSDFFAESVLSAVRCTENERIAVGKLLTSSVDENLKDDGQSTILGEAEKLRKCFRNLYGVYCPSSVLYTEEMENSKRPQWCWLSTSVRRAFLSSQRKARKGSKTGIQHNPAWPTEFPSVDVGSMLADLMFLSYRPGTTFKENPEAAAFSLFDKLMEDDRRSFSEVLSACREAEPEGNCDLTDHIQFAEPAQGQKDGNEVSLWSHLRKYRETQSNSREMRFSQLHDG